MNYQRVQMGFCQAGCVRLHDITPGLDANLLRIATDLQRLAFLVILCGLLCLCKSISGVRVARVANLGFAFCPVRLGIDVLVAKIFLASCSSVTILAYHMRHMTTVDLDT